MIKTIMSSICRCFSEFDDFSKMIVLNGYQYIATNSESKKR